jgi:hypothetical protein
MPSINYAGKPYPRHYAPAAPRILTNGTQSVSAYTAPLAYLDPETGAYSVVLRSGYDYTDLYGLLLFLSDYPATVYGYATFRDCLDIAGNPITPSVITRDVAYNVVNGGNISFSFGLQNPEAVIYDYQQIIEGITVTHNVKIGGFSGFIEIDFSDIYNNFEGNLLPAASTVTLNVMSNGAKSETTSAFSTAQTLTLPSEYRIPIILWEQNFTQQIKDDQMTLLGTYVRPDGEQFPAIFDVVGIWSGSQPYPTPPPAPSPFRAPLEPETRARALPRFPWARP